MSGVAAAAYAGAVTYPPRADNAWTEEEDAVFGQIFYFLRYLQFKDTNGQLDTEPTDGASGSPLERSLLAEVFALRGTVALQGAARGSTAPLLQACPIAGVQTAADAARVAAALMARCSEIARQPAGGARGAA